MNWLQSDLLICVQGNSTYVNEKLQMMQMFHRDMDRYLPPQMNYTGSQAIYTSTVSTYSNL